AVLLGGWQNQAAEKKYVIKFGSIAPRGTIWARYFRKMKFDLQKKSKGRIKVKLYLGGIAGDEITMIRKMKNGTLQMVNLTGIGMGMIVPAMRVLEVPLLIKTEKQIDRAVKKLTPPLREKFKKKGFILAGWGEAGWVYLMTKQPFKKVSELRGRKVWMPSGGKLVKESMKELGLIPVPLGIESVLPQLQTNGIDVIYAPPSAAIGFQWYREIKYLYNIPLTNLRNANFVSKKFFKKLPEDLQKLVLQVSEENMHKSIAAVRKENRRALKVLKKKGIVFIEPPKDQVAYLNKASRNLRKRLIGKMYSKKFLQMVLKAIR
ncbi:MAG: hypothetical protein D6767_03830, partial [Candidatus Hydrogenedentota bacterium]